MDAEDGSVGDLVTGTKSQGVGTRTVANGDVSGNGIKPGSFL